MAQVVKLAALHGWHAYHTYDSRRSTAGFPDAIFIRDDTLVAVEFKSERGKLSEAQRDWLDAFAKVRRVIVAVWRPSDVPAIEKVLR